ncbi:hypothetical protein D3C81_1914340 [compost metagenome]
MLFDMGSEPQLLHLGRTLLLLRLFLLLAHRTRTRQPAGRRALVEGGADQIHLQLLRHSQCLGSGNNAQILPLEAGKLNLRRFDFLIFDQKEPLLPL